MAETVFTMPAKILLDFFMARLLACVDCALMPILWLYAARAAQTTGNPETDRLKSSHSV